MLLSYVSNHKVQLGVVVYLAMWLIIQLVTSLRLVRWRILTQR